MAAWINSDGLRVKLGVTEANVSRGGEVEESGFYRVIEQNVKLSLLTTSGVIQNYGILVPKGSRVHKVLVISETAATGATAVLNIGRTAYDKTTVTNTTGFVAAQTLATMSTVGTETETRTGTTYAGADLDTTLDNPYYINFSYSTAAFTAGEAKVVFYLYVPQPAATN